MLTIPDQILLELQKIVNPEIYDNWLKTKNEVFDNKSPLELLKLKKFSPLWIFIDANKSKVFDTL